MGACNLGFALENGKNGKLEPMEPIGFDKWGPRKIRGLGWWVVVGYCTRSDNVLGNLFGGK